MKKFWQVAEGISVQPLLDQLANVPTAEPGEEFYPYFGPVKWRKVTEWTWKKGNKSAIADSWNIPLRYVTAQRSNEGVIKPTVWGSQHPPGTLSAAWPIVERVVAGAGGDIKQLGHVIITRMPPKTKIPLHKDHPPRDPQTGNVLEGFPYWQRHQVPLKVHPKVVFHCGGEQLWMQPGLAYGFDAQDDHWVYNGSPEDRLTMIVEIRT